VDHEAEGTSCRLVYQQSPGACLLDTEGFAERFSAVLAKFGTNINGQPSTAWVARGATELGTGTHMKPEEWATFEVVALFPAGTKSETLLGSLVLQNTGWTVRVAGWAPVGVSTEWWFAAQLSAWETTPSGGGAQCLKRAGSAAGLEHVATIVVRNNVTVCEDKIQGDLLEEHRKEGQCNVRSP